MKKRSDRIQRVQDIAENEERGYSRALGEAQRQLDEQQKRLQELRQYRSEYASRQPRGKGGAISSVQWADYQNFLRRLDDAVHAQAQLVADGKRNRDAHRQRWMKKRQKTESLQRVVDRYRSDELRADERAEQKIQDDLPLQPNQFARR